MVDIVLKDRDGNDVIYEGVETILLNLTDGTTKEFIAGNIVEKTLSPNFSNGNIDVIPEDEDTYFSKVTIVKPETLVAENIAEGVTIAGITGSLKPDSGGGDNGEGGLYEGFNMGDENLRYFAYYIDFVNKTITIYKILYDKIYEHTGSYDVTIPNTIGNYDVILSII